MGAIPPFVIAGFVIIGVIVLLLFGALGWFFIFRKKKNYPFILYSRDCTNRRIVYASLKADPENRESKLFFFPGMDTRLPLKEPTCFQNGTAYREIMQDPNGGYSYIKGTKIDEEEFLKVSLTPDEKTLALGRLKENNARYQNPMSKTQAAMLITGFIMVIILVIGIVYSTIAYVRSGKDVVKVAQETGKIASSLDSTTVRLGEISVQLAQITAALTKENNINTNITRQIS